MQTDYSRVKRGCYVANAVMAVVNIIPALLFVTFRTLYDLSFTLLGLLVVLNFTTQLIVDLIFSFYAHKFNIEKTVKSIPVISIIGFLLYALLPMMFPNFAYIGICIGTIIVSASCGFAEVLVSPVIAAIPAENPDREMSKVHAVYAWGAVTSTILGTILINFFGNDNWYFIMLIAALLPLYGAICFYNSKLPPLHTHEKTSGVIKLLKNKSMIFCIVLIFLGASTECVIAQWSSSYLERALLLPKIWGDLLGVALFSVSFGIARSLYGKIGTNIRRAIFVSSIGASICYLTIALSNITAINMLAIIMAGFFVAMLWPGALMIVQEKFPTSGVAIFALMAAGGDLGASVGPQIMGVVTDVAISNSMLINISQTLGLSAEQFGMKFGITVTAIAPILVAVLIGFELKNYNKNKKIN